MPSQATNHGAICLTHHTQTDGAAVNVSTHLVMVIIMADDNQVEYMLTTVDNPFDPFTQFDDWLSYDHQLGYNTPSLLARVAIVSDELSETDQALAIQQAIDEIVSENVSGMFRKVSRPNQTT